MRKQETGLKLCPSCNAFQNVTKTECPNCGYDLTKVAIKESMKSSQEFGYAGFWIRVCASIIDTILLLFITLPLLYSIYGREYFDTESLLRGPMDFLISYVLPAIAIITFWVYKSATPGKMAISAKIVDANTGSNPTTGQFIGRYFAYYISTIPLGLGLIWVAFDRKKQGWHDKLAGTVVIRSKNRGQSR